MLSNVTSQQAHDATLEQMRKEVEAERTSTPEARSNLREPGQKGASYNTAADVAAAYHAGKLTKDAATKILRDNGWAR